MIRAGGGRGDAGFGNESLEWLRRSRDSALLTTNWLDFEPSPRLREVSSLGEAAKAGHSCCFMFW